MTGRDQMRPTGSGVKLTYDDFVLFPDDGRRHELIDGEHYVTPSPSTRHQRPELVVEIGSPGTRKRDETIKRRLYETAGVAEYWVVDPELDLIKVYRLSGHRFDRAVALTSEVGDVLTTPLLPGLEMPLARIFAD